MIPTCFTISMALVALVLVPGLDRLATSAVSAKAGHRALALTPFSVTSGLACQ